jgi:hypothetical protein
MARTSTGCRKSPTRNISPVRLPTLGKLERKFEQCPAAINARGLALAAGRLSRHNSSAPSSPKADGRRRPLNNGPARLSARLCISWLDRVKRKCHDPRHLAGSRDARVQREDEQ